MGRVGDWGAFASRWATFGNHFYTMAFNDGSNLKAATDIVPLAAGGLILSGVHKVIV